ncbi:DUF1631 domain-containing protein [Marinobacter sp. M3C]|uniref:DUF1631 family protein n=1 Tax=Marinobacter sp. M3C TaxID=2917715 RepID=UPI00200F63D4|nr:DUF1631 family protein [Marinobacter sp. M3C]UQG60494.1 DUF1631 domain-containing protein [Marinobacter sp. M3C]
MSLKPPQPPASQAKAIDYGETEQVLSSIRVPDLPYPVSGDCDTQADVWRALMAQFWQQQSDARVNDLIGAESGVFSVRQVNAAYLADRLMDVFLTSSGFHLELARRLARTRFYLAWQLDEKGSAAFSDSLLAAFDGLQYWRGWRPGAGRSARMLADQLDDMTVAITEAFAQQKSANADDFFQRWNELTQRQKAQTNHFHDRLLTTEQGAARQRYADQTARALVSRALQGRSLPAAFNDFIEKHWLPLLTRALRDGGIDGSDFRHGRKLLEWLVWLGDPALSDGQRDRLYQVGEQMTDRLLEVWQRIMDLALSANTLYGIQLAMMERMRDNSNCELRSTDACISAIAADLRWLSLKVPSATEINATSERWYEIHQDNAEQRRYFFALLPDTAEILWTNGTGVKLGFQDFSEFCTQRECGLIKPLQDSVAFSCVLKQIIAVLAAAAAQQKRDRATAAAAANARAEALRRERQQREEPHRQQLEVRKVELERLQLQAENQRLAKAKAQEEMAWQQRLRTAEKQVFGLKPGHWIVILDSAIRDAGVERMKLAMRLSTRCKMVFVDRLGLNQREFQEQELVECIAAEQIRVLDSGVNFEDTLSDVVGRIRGGHYSG